MKDWLVVLSFFLITELAVDFHIYPAGEDFKIDEVSLLSSAANHEEPRC
jgi:hypothetical protein